MQISRLLATPFIALLISSTAPTVSVLSGQVTVDEEKLRRGGSSYERPKMESARVVLYPQGFYPQEVTFTAGLVNLLVHNRSGVEELPLVLELNVAAPTAQDVLKSESLAPSQNKWSGDAVLPEGEYRLRVEGRPKWSCDVHVLAAPKVTR